MKLFSYVYVFLLKWLVDVEKQPKHLAVSSVLRSYLDAIALPGSGPFGVLLNGSLR